jgi:hypothetical protein
MNTSATHELLSEIKSAAKLRPRTIGYFEGRLTGLLHQALLALLRVMEQKDGFSKRHFATRIGKKPEQITRWFSSPNNLTLGTISALFLGAGYEIRGFVVTDLATGNTEHFPAVSVSKTLGTSVDSRS